MNNPATPTAASEDAASRTRRNELTQCLFYLQKAAALQEIPRPGLPNEPANQPLSLGQLLQEQYQALSSAEAKTTAAALYLEPASYPIQTFEEPPLIFPFGINESQLEAIRCAMTSQLSVIQGPPGTGKTQTILNIIANLLLQGKPMQIVSSTNSAASNVQEKLAAPDTGLDFLTAFLGSH